MTTPNLKFDDTVFAHQPTDVWVTPPEGKTTRTLSGGEEVSPPEKGVTIRLVWGRTAAHSEVLTALRAARNGDVVHNLKVTDPAGTEHEYTVNWKSDPPWSTQPWNTLRQITITLTEAP